jgi:hypothetical protein
MHNVGETADGKDDGGGSQARDAGSQPLIIKRLADHHRIVEFSCKKKAKSDRVEQFLLSHARKYAGCRFSSVFIASPAAEPDRVFGFYTLSAAVIKPTEVSKSQQKKVPGHIDFPMAKLGYMGKADDCPVAGLGAMLVLDAAERLIADTTPLGVWGIILDAELGDPKAPGFNPNPATDRLVRFYQDLGFQSLFTQPATHTHSMFARLEWLIPSPVKD